MDKWCTNNKSPEPSCTAELSRPSRRRPPSVPAVSASPHFPALPCARSPRADKAARSWRGLAVGLLALGAGA